MRMDVPVKKLSKPLPISTTTKFSQNQFLITNVIKKIAKRINRK